MKLYVSYQQTGGQDEWVPVHADTDMQAIKPALITVLACDKLINKQSTKETVDTAKYLGPLYFDLDDEDDLEAVIEDGNKVLQQLFTYGLTADDVQIYLSGKKGLHILVPSTVFMEKQLPVNRLPHIYKEMAFKFAVQSTDFAVYSARRGRMFRTCYVQRDNGKWRVPVTAAELATLTVKGYGEMCSAPRTVPATVPTYRPKLAILYESILQQVAAAKKIKRKPVDAATFRKHLPTIQKLMKGEGLKDGIGFNKIAIQLAIYAREANITEDELVFQSSGLIANHVGDGHRYNTPRKREIEIRRMFSYIEEGVGYDYSIYPIQAMLATAQPQVGDFAGEDESIEVIDDSDGLFTKGANFYVTTEQGEKHILDARFKEVDILLTPDTEQIACITAKIQVGNKIVPCALERSDFVSSTALHRAVSVHGASFTGTDVHARYIYKHMLREATLQGKVVYATDREGLDVLKMPMASIEDARAPFIVWADRHGVRLPKMLSDKGLDVRFVGYPSPEGVLKTDLAQAPYFPDWIKIEGNKEKLLSMLRGLLQCQDGNILGKWIGWMSASFYTQLFREAYGKFPLLHINGAAGSGKSEMTESLMHLFYYNGDPTVLSPSSTTFAISTAIAGSASVPVIVDEYKPSEMSRETHNTLKSLFRSSYNGHTVSRGGGNRQKDSFGALSQTELSGPVVFIAEAIEEETALLERCVPITVRRPYGRILAKFGPRFSDLRANHQTLAIIGQAMASGIVAGYSIAKLREEFGVLYQSAKLEYLPQASDYQNEDTEAVVKKEGAKERVVYAHSVALFGVIKFEQMITAMLPDEADELKALVAPLKENIYARMSEVSANTTAEYLKVMLMLSDMSRFADNDTTRLNYGFDYEFGNIGDKSTLVIVARSAFGKYKMYSRAIDVPALFRGAEPFIHALKNSPIFINTGPGTAKLRQETLVLDYEQLQRFGIPAFTK